MKRIIGTLALAVSLLGTVAGLTIDWGKNQPNPTAACHLVYEGGRWSCI